MIILCSYRFRSYYHLYSMCPCILPLIPYSVIKEGKGHYHPKTEEAHREIHNCPVGLTAYDSITNVY